MRNLRFGNSYEIAEINLALATKMSESGSNTENRQLPNRRSLMQASN